MEQQALLLTNLELSLSAAKQNLADSFTSSLQLPTQTTSQYAKWIEILVLVGQLLEAINRRKAYTLAQSKKTREFLGMEYDEATEILNPDLAH
jgi:hypothetical protein